MKTDGISGSTPAKPKSTDTIYTLIKVAIALILAIGAFLGARFGGLNMVGQIVLPSLTLVATLLGLFCMSCGQNEEELQENTYLPEPPPKPQQTKSTKERAPPTGNKLSVDRGFLEKELVILRGRLQEIERPIREDYQKRLEGLKKEIERIEEDIGRMINLAPRLRDLRVRLNELHIAINACDAVKPPTEENDRKRQQFFEEYTETRGVFQTGIESIPSIQAKYKELDGVRARIEQAKRQRDESLQKLHDGQVDVQRILGKIQAIELQLQYAD